MKELRRQCIEAGFDIDRDTNKLIEIDTQEMYEMYEQMGVSAGVTSDARQQAEDLGFSFVGNKVALHNGSPKWREKYF